MPQKYTWAGVFISIYGGEAAGKLIPYILGVIMFSGNDKENIWHFLVAILSVPSVLFIILALLFMDESPTYLWSKDKKNQATEILAKMSSNENIKNWSDKFFVHKRIDLSKTKDGKISSLEKLKFLLENGPVMRSLICVTVIGCSVKYTTFGLSYIATELLFLSGQTDSNYCSGSERRTYFLDSSDYLVLSAFVISAFCVKVLAMIVAKKFDMGLKISGAVCLGVSLCLATCLYACPEYWVALIIYGLIDASSAVVELNYIMFVAKIVPANIRSSIYGFMKFFMYLPLPVTPYLIQVLAKESQHYLTTTTVLFIAISLIAVLMIPNNIQSSYE